jgi:hypothetical protein
MKRSVVQDRCAALSRMQSVVVNVLPSLRSRSALTATMFFFIALELQGSGHGGMETHFATLHALFLSPLNQIS